MSLEEIRSEIIRLSGSGKRVAPNARKHGIYSSFTIPGLNDMIAVRDTAQRYRDFGIPANLSCMSFIDIGSNVGAMIFEAVMRGADVTGVEYRQDRVDLCQKIASHFDMKTAEFFQCDLNKTTASPGWLDKKYKFVLCCSVDEYISDLEGFYEFLYNLCDDTLYLESNIQGGGQSVEETLAILERTGFKDSRYLGNGHAGGIARRRKLFKATI